MSPREAKEKQYLSFIHSRKQRGWKQRVRRTIWRNGRQEEEARKEGKGNMRKKYREGARTHRSGPGNIEVSLATYGGAVMEFMDLYKTLF